MAVQIFFIYADNCKHCAAALKTIHEAVEKSKVECEVLEFLFSTPVALNIARKNGIDDLPGFVIGQGEAVFKGDDYTEEAIVGAIKNIAKELSMEMQGGNNGN